VRGATQDDVAENVSLGDPLLDNPAWGSLTGHHAGLAIRHGKAARLPADVSPFTALSDHQDEQAWRDLATLVGPDTPVVVTGSLAAVPDGWTVLEQGEGVQFVDTSLAAAPDLEAVVLGPDDVPAMLDLVARTQPGPFLPRTIELGTYLGIKRDGRLVAMAGERLHPPGWVEVSAVCTDPAHQGQGLATRLVQAVANGIRERGEQVFLHTAASNTRAIRLYAAIGFTLRRRTTFALLQTPTADR
jgi:ribosomal protein S18 acetylase RimI-like enzyme